MGSTNNPPTNPQTYPTTTEPGLFALRLYSLTALLLSYWRWTFFRLVTNSSLVITTFSKVNSIFSFFWGLRTVVWVTTIYCGHAFMTWNDPNFFVIIQRILCSYFSLYQKIGKLAVKQQIQCVAWFDSLFSTSRQITPYTTKDSGTIHGSKAPRYFLLDFCHSNIIFTQIIRKRYDLIIHKPECVLLIVSQPL